MDNYQVGYDFLFSASIGAINGVRTVNFSGFRSGVTTANGERSDLTELDGDSYVFPSDDGEDMTIGSDDTADTEVTITVDGLGADKKRLTVQVELEGTTRVPLPSQMCRVNAVVNSGGKTFSGSVTVENVAGTNVYSKADPSAQQAIFGVYTNPVDERVTIYNFTPSMRKDTGGGTGADVGVSFRVKGGSFRTPVAVGLYRDGSTSVVVQNTVPDTFPGFTDIKLVGRADASNVELFARMGLVLSRI